jgi:hypothetical protein
MKYVKTFENFSYSPINEEEEIFKKIGEFFTGLYNKAKAKFQNWRDAKKKAAVEKISTFLEKNKDNAKVQECIAKIQGEYAKLDEKEKQQLESFQNEAKIDEMNKKLENSGLEEMMPAKEGKINESLILENAATVIGNIAKYAAVAVGVAAILYWGFAMITLVGAGYVMAGIVGAGMSAGGFSVIICAILAACGVIGGVGAAMSEK